MSDDPFEDFDPEREREGDPFTDLDDQPDAPTDETDADDEVEDEAADVASMDTQLDDQPFSEPDDGARKRRAHPDTEDPLADIDISTGGDPFESGDWSVDDADESVWEDLSQQMEAEPATEQEGGRRLSEVNKHSFCEQCEYFSGPPEIACTHEGTEILEFLDMETVRVADCPIVKERERLENAGTQG